MKKLGIVGGLSPESTIPYYKGIVYGVQKKIGDNILPNLTIESINVYQVLNLCVAQKYDELTEYLLAAINNLAAAGADFAAISANTPHIVFDRLAEKSPLPLVSIIDACCNEALNRGLKKIALMGTKFTMEGDFFKKPFIKAGIELITPNNNEIELINQKILSELEQGIVRDETRDIFIKIIERMKAENGAEAIILGCTELPLILNDSVSPLPCLDTMQIHIKTLVDLITAP